MRKIFLLFALMQMSDLLVSSSELLVNPSDRKPEVLELTSDNYDEFTSKYLIVVLNFYADWCPYSTRWKPVFQETATLIYNETLHLDPNTIVFGQINCELQTTLAQRFRVTKYPTTKLTLNGKVLKKEYRGARTTTAFRDYVKKYLSDPIAYIKSPLELKEKVEEKKGAVIIYSGFMNETDDKPIESAELQIIRRVAQQFREYCQFYYVLRKASGDKVLTLNTHSVIFKPHHKGTDHEVPYGSKVTDGASLGTWVKDQCIPLIREITFENAEELTEDGLPFVILFYDPSDKTWIEVFQRVAERELVEEANRVTLLIADGHVFSHPLKHLGKTTKDLPVVAIDSFRHLFLYKKPVATISQPGNLKQFILDLHSGKLDREFHFGPDPTSQKSQTGPPESAFNKLGPSSQRYSLLPRDEL